jgi:hypothetical protein
MGMRTHTHVRLLVRTCVRAYASVCVAARVSLFSVSVGGAVACGPMCRAVRLDPVCGAVRADRMRAAVHDGARAYTVHDGARAYTVHDCACAIGFSACDGAGSNARECSDAFARGRPRVRMRLRMGAIGLTGLFMCVFGCVCV